VNEVKNSISILSKEATPTKDVGMTVDMTTIPVCSLRSTTSNQVHATLHSDQSSHIKQNNKSNDRQSGAKEGDSIIRWEKTRVGR
jgi:hypothetical protein